MFNWYCAPVSTLLTVMVPVAVVQLGWVNANVGTAGALGAALMLTLAEVAVHPPASRMVTV